MFLKKKKQETKYVYILMKETLGRKREGLVYPDFNIRLLSPEAIRVFTDYDKAVDWLMHIHENTFYDNTELESNGFGSWFTKVRLVPGSTTMDMRTRYWIEEEIVND